MHVLSRVSAVHHECASYGVHVFSLIESLAVPDFPPLRVGSTTAAPRTLNIRYINRLRTRITELQHDLTALGDVLGADAAISQLNRQADPSDAAWRRSYCESLWAALHGPSTVARALAIDLILRPRWMERAGGGTSSARGAQGVIDGLQSSFVTVLSAWVESPSFVKSFEHACAAADTLDAIQRHNQDHLSDVDPHYRPSGPVGNMDGLMFSFPAVVLITSAALAQKLNTIVPSGLDINGLVRMAGVILRAVRLDTGPGDTKVQMMVDWVKSKMTAHVGSVRPL
ncbi:hypothetical protein HDU93_001850 [Gonapodya sp. JEL0774]|nr:hypothetical protein HDU93_001850 [Gonapodya sp. JEL0774]